jgi:hypothetical protein
MSHLAILIALLLSTPAMATDITGVARIVDGAVVSQPKRTIRPWRAATFRNVVSPAVESNVIWPAVDFGLDCRNADSC